VTRADCGYDVSRVPSLKPAGCRKGIAWLPFSRPAATAGTRLLAADIPVSSGTAMVPAGPTAFYTADDRSRRCLASHADIFMVVGNWQIW